MPEQKMKIIYTKHAEMKFGLLEELGWKFSKRQINNTLRKPKWVGRTKFGQYSAMSKLDEGYILGDI